MPLDRPINTTTMTQLVFTVTNDLTYDQRMSRICSALAESGRQVLLVGREKPDSVPLTTCNYQQKRLPCFFQRGKLFYLEYNWHLFWFLLRTPFTAVCGIDLDTALPTSLAAWLKGKKWLLDLHEYFTEVPEVVDRPLTKGIWEAVARLTIPRATAAYTVCQSLAGVFAKKYGREFSVIRNVPLRQAEMIDLAKKTPKILLYQGMLNAGRGLEQAIQAMQHLEGLELWLAGEGDCYAALHQLCHDLQLDSKIRFLGFVRPDALKALTLQATIGLNLLENSGLSYYYSLANKAFDYIQAGLPSLHMNFPEYRAINQEQEVFLLLDELTPRGIADAVNRLIADRDLYQRLHENCRQARKDYCWEVEKIRLLGIYEGLGI